MWSMIRVDMLSIVTWLETVDINVKLEHLQKLAPLGTAKLIGRVGEAQKVDNCLHRQLVEDH